MAEKYSLSEVLHMAETIEHNGGLFYRQAADAVADPNTKKIMLSLAQAESIHEKLFHQMRQELCAQEEADWYDPDGQARRYIRAVADAHIFTLQPNSAQLLASVQSPQSALRLALNFEKDTIAYFSALRQAVKDENQRQIDRLIQEECRHISIINEALAAL